ncbi:ATP-binding protein [Dethiobacter alkaliphilus]|uniref:4Fe-4S ferredoxin iron-sulfur binding domain protein n=1 Tax=Dethiobacter alkaliphilus AHT 1 TaxID=555088 RepID=C0GHY3_DETAL|nr:4Fe-4S binding protein [Dethiobacter alkaliphilus]EEG77057.1 4Fe-4S ferredoxin iron-sulfur binding domain protein [Dethiobacter alkaliphilus AHT 1]
MGHLVGKDVYRKLGSKMDSMQVRVPWNEKLYEILKELYTPEEAEVYCKMPYALSSLDKIARVSGLDTEFLEKTLYSLCSKGLVIDIWVKGKYRYMPSPMVIGVFEFTMMRTGENTDSKHWARLFHQYLSDEDFIAANYKDGQRISPLRALPYESALGEHVEILDYEKATAIIEKADKFAIGLCSCRHEKMHVGEKQCDVPLEMCSSMGKSADYLIRNNLAREVSKEDALENLARSLQYGLVLNADNVQKNVSFICHCCKCCCNALAGISRFGYANAVVTSSFIAAVLEGCTGCGKCVQACPVDAIGVTDKEEKKAQIDTEYCLGCGVCTVQCPTKALVLKKRKQKVLHPENTFERVLLQSLERDTLPDLLFAHPEGMTPKLMKGMLGGFLRLPGMKRALMSDALRSRFLDRMKAMS